MSAGVRLRRMLAELPLYRAGQRPAQREDLRTYKLSSNENPVGPPEAVLSSLPDSAIHLYPDPGNTELIAALADYLGVSPEQVCVGCGSVSLCQNVVQIACDPGDEVVHAWRSFEAYPIVASISSAVSVQVPLTADARHDGAAVTHEEAVWVIDQLGPEILVVIDEAYHEYVTSPDAVRALELAQAHPNVMVLRTFSKAFGLAGLRVGYGIGSAEVVAAMRKVATPFGVSTVAQAAAVASLQPEGLAHMRTTVAASVTERDRMVSVLRDAGWTVPDSQANFVWITTERAPDVAAALDAAGLTVRPFPEGVRISVGPVAANDRVLSVLGSSF